MLIPGKQLQINYPLLLQVTGWLLFVEAGLMAIPATVSLIMGESDAMPLGITAGITAVAGVLMSRLRPESSQLGRREGFLLTATVWLWFSVFGMIPLIFGGLHYSVTDAFFEAMAGFTTTGATVMPDGAELSYGMNLWRALMQWIGGMGILLFTIAVLPSLNSSGGMQIFNAEVPGITHDKVLPRISSTAKALWGIYMSLTLLSILLLSIGPMSFFDSVCYSLVTISTGGFAPTGTTLADLNSNYTLLVITVFMFLGAVNFNLIFRALTNGFKVLWQNEVFRKFLYVIALFYILFIVGIFVDKDCTEPMTWETFTIYPLFHVVSIISTAGLDSGHYMWWNPFTTNLAFFLIFSGACAGSTTGGAKFDRVIFTLKYYRNALVHAVRPNTIFSVRMNDKVQSPELVDKVLAFLGIYILLICAGTLLVSLFDYSIVDSFFVSSSCLANNSCSATGSTFISTYCGAPDALKWIMAALMLIGRLEIFTILVIFTKAFWRK